MEKAKGRYYSKKVLCTRTRLVHGMDPIFLITQIKYHDEYIEKHAAAFYFMNIEYQRHK